MMILILGLALLAFTMLGAFWSTLTSGGGGLLTRRVARGLLHGFVRSDGWTWADVAAPSIS